MRVSVRYFPNLTKIRPNTIIPKRSRSVLKLPKFRVHSIIWERFGTIILRTFLLN